jgi:hypothetical protein
MKKQNEEKTVKKRLSNEAFKKFVERTIHIPVSNGYITKCYCRRCGSSWDMRADGVKSLLRENPENASMPELKKENLEKYFFVIEPCFMCRRNGEKIKIEAKPYKK